MGAAHLDASDQNVHQQQVQDPADHGQVRGGMFVVLGHQGGVGLARQRRLAGGDGNHAGALLGHALLQRHQFRQVTPAADEERHRSGIHHIAHQLLKVWIGMGTTGQAQPQEFHLRILGDGCVIADGKNFNPAGVLHQRDGTVNFLALQRIAQLQNRIGRVAQHFGTQFQHRVLLRHLGVGHRHRHTQARGQTELEV